MAMTDKSSTDVVTMSLTRRGITWLLFAVMSVTVPSLFFLIQAVAFIPLIAIGLSVFQEPGFAILAGIHIVIIGGIYFGISYLAAQMISAIPSEFVRKGVLLSIITLLMALTFLPIYITGGHGR